MTNKEDRTPKEQIRQDDRSQEIFREVITIRPTTSTRPSFTITITQRIADNGETAMATAIVSKQFDIYYEKPNFMKDFANKMIYAAELMEKLNKRVKNGK